VKGKASVKLAELKDSGLDSTSYFPVVKLLEVAEKGGLYVRPSKKTSKGSGTGVAQVKPARSLCKEDLSGDLSELQLQQRINEIARSCGGGPLVGRVRSAELFKGDETVSYRQWWDAASPHERMVSLTEGKRRETFTTEEVGRIEPLQCPFRGTLEFTVKEE